MRRRQKQLRRPEHNKSRVVTCYTTGHKKDCDISTLGEALINRSWPTPIRRSRFQPAPSGAEVAAAGPKMKTMTITTAEEVAKAVTVLELQETADERKEQNDNEFPQSDFYLLGKYMFEKSKKEHNGIMSAPFQGFTVLINRGVTIGCVQSIFCWATLFIQQKQTHNAVPYLLEGAIRGHTGCILKLSTNVYSKTIPRVSSVLKQYWMELFCIWNDSTVSEGLLNPNSTKQHSIVEAYTTMTDKVGLECIICAKRDSDTVNLVKCAGCKHYFYCGEECQRIHWKGRYNHRGECKHLNILKKYHKPHANEIREAVIRGDCNIIPLQKLRMELGLSRPKEEYPEFHPLKEVRGEVYHGPSYNPCKLLVARKDGTVHIGSSPNPMEPNCDTPTGAAPIV